MVARAIAHDSEAHHVQRVPVGDLARLSGLPASRFSDAFKAATGHSPQQYLMPVRAGHARRLLNTTNLSLAEIAFKCGFFRPVTHDHVVHSPARHAAAALLAALAGLICARSLRRAARSTGRPVAYLLDGRNPRSPWTPRVPAFQAAFLRP
ncbi:MAG: helix-turn-helix domain-containing protein [Rhodoferax sp.]